MENTAELYLDLLEKVVTNLVYEDAPIPNEWFPEREFRPENRETGTDWPSVAHTMVGLKRIRNIRTLLDRVVADGVPGDFIETGVWRGGVCIFARGYLKAHGITDRNVWLADSFEGIPDTGEDGHPMDREMALHRCNGVLGVTADTVRENFGRYGLLDDQVRFLPGWFKDTLPTAPVERLAVLRLDGDLYESTLDALDNLYPKLSAGGFVVIDDYFIPACRKAVDEFREKHGIADEIEAIDEYSVFWRRSA
ncbi:TylF/MycF family methyltransferase [Streptomyces virginiae]|uniref:TylF/MycF family methyltransferase n=1 Tax=Streptomyces virginiae TaxID=1961 RepID=UPI0038281BD8